MSSHNSCGCTSTGGQQWPSLPMGMGQSPWHGQDGQICCAQPQPSPVLLGLKGEKINPDLPCFTSLHPCKASPAPGVFGG